MLFCRSLTDLADELSGTDWTVLLPYSHCLSNPLRSLICEREAIPSASLSLVRRAGC